MHLTVEVEAGTTEGSRVSGVERFRPMLWVANSTYLQNLTPRPVAPYVSTPQISGSQPELTPNGLSLAIALQ